MKRLSLVALVASGFSLVVAAAQDRIVDPIDLSRTAPIRGQHPPQAVSQNDVGLADPAAQLSYVTILLRPAPGLEEFLRRQQTPGSPDYHRWLTPDQFGDRFGLSASDIGKIVQWLQGQGLQVQDVARGRHWITFSGSIARVSRALHTEFRRYAVNGEMHVANATDPMVPAAFSAVVAGFHGLDDFEPRPMHREAAPRYNANLTHYLAPGDFATVYNLKPLYDQGIDGTGVSIAVIGRTDIDITDIQAFRDRFGLPPNDPEMVLYGPDPGTNSSDQSEANLDVEWAGAVAKNAHIIYVNSRSVLTSAQYAIDHNLAPVMTYSYGSCEQATTMPWRSIAQQANAQGITWMASSGDAGAATCDWIYSPTPQASFGPTVSFPANLPELTAVGGTQFNEGGDTYWAASNDSSNSSVLSYIPEKVWNESAARNDMVASGGGPSAFFAKPWWQIGTPDDKVRDLPDISLSAGTHDPYSVILKGALHGFGGTSASSPAFAGIVAMLNQYLMKQGAITQPGLGNINPALYRLAQAATDVFHDTEDGDNNVPCVQGSPKCVDGLMGYTAVGGYDLATGLGTVDAYNLVTQWSSGTASQTSLSATPSSVDLTSTVTLTATVTGGGKMAPTGTVQFITSDTTIGTATLAPSAHSGGATAGITVPAPFTVFGQGPVYALYSGDTVYSGSSGLATVTLNVPAGHSLVVPFISPVIVPQTSSGAWVFTVGLSEKAGVSTRLTSVTFDGSNVSLSLFGGGNIAASGTLSTALAVSGAAHKVPFDSTFVFKGQDADGTTWTQQLTATFAGPFGNYIVPAMTLASTPDSVQQNPQAPSFCQWKQELTLEEHAGFAMQLTKLTIAAADYSGQIQPLFGTTRLAPYGTLHATICWDTGTITAPSGRMLTITAAASNGLTATASVLVQFEPPPAAAAAFSASTSAVELSARDAEHNAGATVDLTFSGGAPTFQVTVLPGNTTTGWLSVTPLSGNGSGRLTIQANTAGLSAGVYQAEIAVTAPDAVPDHVVIPVILAVGASSNTITALANAASFQPVYAPGMLAAVYGTGLSAATSTAKSIPLPLKLNGVSATVNGVSAPVVGTFPDSSQINIQIPYEAGSGPAVLAINNNGQISYYRFMIDVVAPGLFGVWDLKGSPAATVQRGQTVIAHITGAGDVTPTLATGATPSSTTSVSRLPKPRQPLALSIGGEDVGTPLFTGIPSGAVGVTQINFTIPADAPLGTQPLVVTVGGVASNTVTLTVTQ